MSKRAARLTPMPNSPISGIGALPRAMLLLLVIFPNLCPPGPLGGRFFAPGHGAPAVWRNHCGIAIGIFLLREPRGRPRRGGLATGTGGPASSSLSSARASLATFAHRVKPVVGDDAIRPSHSDHLVRDLSEIPQETAAVGSAAHGCTIGGLRTAYRCGGPKSKSASFAIGSRNLTSRANSCFVSG